VLTRKRRITLFVVTTIIVGGAFLLAYKRLTGNQFFLFIVGGILFVSLLEVIAIAYDNKRREATPASGSPLEMIGRTASVVEACSPEGKVAIGNEIWNAVSLNGEFLKVGEQVIVQGRDGLTLTVESAPSETR